MTVDGATYSVDMILEVLADRRCRSVIRSLKRNSEVTSFEELADHVAAQSSSEFDSEKAAVLLHHVLLPKLERTSLIEYDPRSGTIRYQPNPVARDVLETLDRYEP